MSKVKTVTSVKVVLDELAATTSTNRKRELLRQHCTRGSDLQLVLHAALDPYRMYYVREVPPVKPPLRGVKSLVGWPGVEEKLLTPLTERTLSGHAAIGEITRFMLMMTADDQEVLRRILRKDLRCGVKSKTVNAVMPGLVPEFKIQLAAADTSKMVFPCYGEPKIDGMRTLAFCGGDTAAMVKFVTRGGRPLETMDKWCARLAELKLHGWVLDAEVQATRFQKTLSVVKRSRKNATNEEAKLLVFDMLPVADFDRRSCEYTLEQRRKMMQMRLDTDVVTVLPIKIIRSMAEAVAFYEDCLRRGYEGAVFKDPKGKYEFKRSRAWVKMKPEKTVDVEITGYREGKGKYKGMLGAFTFDYEGQECRAGSGLSDAERVKFWRKRKQMVGVTIEVEFTEETDGGKTRHARLVAVREHGGERS